MSHPAQHPAHRPAQRPVGLAAARRPAPRRGFTLVELMISLLSGMALVVGVTLMLTRFETGRRTLSSLTATHAGSAQAVYLLDRQLRSAGSGFLKSGPESLGCALRAARGGTQLLPRTSAFPAPFAAVPTALRLAPIVAFAGAGTNGSDLLMLATGASGLGEVPMRVLPGSVSSDRLRVPATVGLRDGDLVLVSEDGQGCMVQQVSSGFVGGADQLLTFGGTYAAATIASQNLASMGVSQTAWMSVLGNVTGNRPQLRVYGVGGQSTLVSLDLLRLDGSEAVVPEADGIVDLRVRYGTDSNGDGLVDLWVAPDATGWRAADLLDGSAAAQTRMRQILAAQVALVVRDPTLQRENVTADSLTLFSDLPTTLQVQHAVTGDQRQYRHRVIEFTVPLRNAML